MHTVKEDIQQFRILYVEKDDRRVQSFQQNFQDQADITSVPDGQTALDYLAAQSLVDLIVYNDALDSTTWFLNKLGPKRTATNPPVVLLTDRPGLDLTTDKFYGRVIDAFPQNYSQFDLRIRLNYLIQKKAYEQSEHTTDDATTIRMPLGKRLFDIGFALLLLTAASPILLIAAILIKLDSKGPIFYSSKRVGTGFKIFDMYKFRTMRTGADKMLAGMASLNMYNTAPANRSDTDLCDTCRMGGTACQRPLFMDQKQICEVLHQQEQKEKAMFSKFKEDPRVTRLGKILRNTSIDELPQLFNILRGDMSFVGNRPLPVYEAEKLTTIGYNRRFAAPAGLTGLWQVMKRGKSKVSDQERIHLDVLYAKTYSFRTDMLILLKTIKAVWQKENV